MIIADMKSRFNCFWVARWENDWVDTWFCGIEVLVGVSEGDGEWLGEIDPSCRVLIKGPRCMHASVPRIVGDYGCMLPFLF